MRRVIQLILLVVSVGLSYLIINSIQRPIEFNKQKDKRYKKVIERLEDIKSAQLAYKSVVGKYTASWDTLIGRIKTDSFPVVMKNGFVPDSLTEAQALKLGIVTRDTIRVSMLDSLFPAPKSIDSLPFVPMSNGEKFELQAGLLETNSKMIVPVFEVSVLNKIILNGLDKQEIINLNDERKKLDKYPGLKVGSMTEAHTNGNWESL